MAKLIRDIVEQDYEPGIQVEYVMVPGPPGPQGPQGPAGVSGDGVTNVFISPDPVVTEVPEYLWIQPLPDGGLTMWVEDGTA